MANGIQTRSDRSAFWLAAIASVPVLVIATALVLPDGLPWAALPVLVIAALALVGTWRDRPGLVMVAGALALVAAVVSWLVFIPIHWIALVLATGIAYLVAAYWTLRPPTPLLDMAPMQHRPAAWTSAMAVLAALLPVAVMAALVMSGHTGFENVPEGGGSAEPDGREIPPLFLLAALLCGIAAAGVLLRHPAVAWAGATLFTGFSALAYTLVFTLPLALPLLATLGAWHRAGLQTRAAAATTL